MRPLTPTLSPTGRGSTHQPALRPRASHLQAVEGEAPHRFGKQPLLVREGEIHGAALALRSPNRCARKRSRRNDASKLRRNAGGSFGLTRTDTKEVPFPSRRSSAPVARSSATATVAVRLIPAPAAIFSRSTPRLVWLRCQPVSP